MRTRSANAWLTIGMLVCLVCLAWPSATLAKTKIVMWDWSYAEREALFREWFEEFEAMNPDIEIEYQGFPAEQLGEKYLTAAASGTGPDFGNMHSSWRYEAVAGGLLEPYGSPGLSEQWMDENLYRFSEWFRQDGHYYTIPAGVMAAIFYRNTGMWSESGLGESDIPRTWDEVARVSQKLTRYDSRGDIVIEGFNFNGHVGHFWTDLMLQLGGQLVGSDGKTATLNSEAGLEALQYINDLVYKHKVSSPLFPKYTEAFGTQKAATIYSWTWVSNYFNTSFPDLNYAVSPLPSFGKSNVLGQVNPEEGWVVFKNTTQEKKDAAKRFIAFVTSDSEKQLSLAKLYEVVPMKRDVIGHAELESIPAVDILSQDISKYVYLGHFPSELTGILERMGESVFFGGQSCEGALEAANQEWQEVLDEKTFWFTNEAKGLD